MQTIDEAFGAQLGEIVSKRCQRVVGGGSTQSIGGVGVDFGGGEAILCRNVRKADERLHECELSGVIELEPWNAFAVGQNRGLGELEQLSAVHERFQDVLLDVVIPV